MRSVKVKFKDTQYDFSTSINGTEEEIRAYYVNHVWNVGTYRDCPDEGANWQMCIDVEFLRDTYIKQIKEWNIKRVHRVFAGFPETMEMYINEWNKANYSKHSDQEVFEEWFECYNNPADTEKRMNNLCNVAFKQ